MNQSGIIFDFDGVIALSEPVHARAYEDMARELNKELPAGLIESGIGKTDSGLSQELAEIWGDGLTGAEILQLKRERYRGRVLSEAELVPGAERALHELSSRCPLALATSSSRGDVMPYLEHHGLDRFFKAILTFESVTQAKPHPEIYLSAARELDRPAERCWVFEDSIQGANAARSAGARLIAITTTYTAQELMPAHAAFPNFESLEPILELMQNGTRPVL